MVFIGCDEARGEFLLASVRELVHEQEQLLSRFRPGSGIAAINAAAGRRPVRPDEKLWTLLLLCRDYWTRTAGAFDITMLPLIELWKRCRHEATEPSDGAIESARELCGFELLDFDERAGRVQLLRNGAGLDLGGIGKGLVADAVALRLREAGVDSAFLSFGESTVYGLGRHPSGHAWPVGLAAQPGFESDRARFPLADSGFSCSGTPDWTRQQSGSITINPYTGRILTGARCVAVAAQNATEAEVLSTAYLVSNAENRLRLASAFSVQSALAIERLDGRDLSFVRFLWSYPARPHE